MIKRNSCALGLFAICASIASAQIGVIKTYAGNDSGSYPGNGGPATSAIITNPFGVAVDASGNLYIAASGNSVIRQVNAGTGIITTVAGGGTGGDGGLATAAQLSNPCDVKLDSAGNMYLSETCVVSEQGSGGGGGGSGTAGIARIRRVDAITGIITTIAGTASSGFAGDGGPANSALLNLPTGLGIDSAGDIFIADSGNNRIRRIDAISGVITTVAGNGAAVFAGDGGPATSASLNEPTGVAVDADGNLYIADTGNSRIRRVDAISGNVTTVAGTGATGFNGDGIAATTATLSTPANVILNTSGNLVFTDLGNFRVRMIDNSGLIWTIAGDGVRSSSGDNGQASLASLNGPVGVAVSPSGPLFISELFGDHVRQVTLPSAVTATAAYCILDRDNASAIHSGDLDRHARRHQWITLQRDRRDDILRRHHDDRRRADFERVGADHCVVAEYRNAQYNCDLPGRLELRRQLLACLYADHRGRSAGDFFFLGQPESR